MDAMSFGHRGGLNYKLPALQASIGRSQLRSLDSRIAERQEKSDLWRIALGIGASNSSLVEFDTNGIAHNGYSFAVQLTMPQPGLARAISGSLFDLGVNTDIHRYKQSYLVNFPVLKPFYDDKRYCGDCRVDFPNSTKIIDSLLVLPLHDQISEDDILIASERLRSIL
jgi:dTDP-4-amino-4,6-dideoxygalactose transaminase